MWFFLCSPQHWVRYWAIRDLRGPHTVRSDPLLLAAPSHSFESHRQVDPRDHRVHGINPRKQVYLHQNLYVFIKKLSQETTENTLSTTLTYYNRSVWTLTFWTGFTSEARTIQAPGSAAIEYWLIDVDNDWWIR